MGGQLGRDQLRELISILGELRNAGPRDNRFKQWRQVTVTLLQRLWPNQQERAERFRRIPFSAPTMLADRKATREHYERGCSEAIGYLESLVQELTPGSARSIAASSRTSPKPPQPFEAEATAAPADGHAAAPPTPSGAPAAPQEESDRAAVSFRPTQPFEPKSVPVSPPPPAAREESVLDESEVERPVTGPRPRLKDMLGFGDEGLAPPSPAPPSPPASGARAAGHSTSAGPHAPWSPSRPEPGPDPPLEPTAPPPDRTPEARRDLAAEFVLESTVLQSKARPLSRTASPSASPAETGVAEVMALVERLDDLGVPVRHHAIVRAALIDLGRQMESPPIYWDSIRQAITLAMDHPELARRVLPLLMPYLDRAA